MATGAKAGRIAFVAVGASTSAFAEIGEVRNWEINVTHTPIDATSNDSSGWNESIGGQRGWTINSETLYVSGEADQTTIRKSLSSQSLKYFQLRPSTALTQKWVGQGWANSYRVGGSHDQAQLFNFGVQGTGPITFTT